MHNTIELENVNKVYADSSKYGRPLYAMIGDDKNLYTYDDSVRYTNGNPVNNQIKISMPNNYTLDNIQNIIFDYVKPQVPGHVLKHVNSFRTG